MAFFAFVGEYLLRFCFLTPKIINKINKHIEVVMTYIADLDIMSLRTCHRVCETLKKHYVRVGYTVIRNESDLKNLVKRKPDLVFSGVKYVGFDERSILVDSNEKIWLSEYLTRSGINHTGSLKKALELEFNKGLAKRKMEKNDVKTAPYFISSDGQYKNVEELPLKFPLFVKPVYQGGGSGIGKDSVVRDFESFEKKVKSIDQDFCQPALVEKYLVGREFTVGVMSNNIGGLEAMPVELVAQENVNGDRILGALEKNDDQERVVAVKDARVREKIVSVAKKAFRSLGARDFGRIDIRMDKNDVPHFLEANLLPGMGLGYFFRSCKLNKGFDYDDMILGIVDVALGRA